MRVSFLLTVVFGFAVSTLSAQQRPTSTAPPAASAGPCGSCAKAVTIYLDASGTMTQPMRNRGNRLPISDIAQTLLRFVSADNFLAPGDTVTVKYFGSAVRTQAENRQAAIQLLTQLADPSTAKSAAAALAAGDLKNLTDFSRLFDDIANRVRNAPRQILFVASDFAHDQLNNAGCPDDADARMQDFSAALNRLKPILAESLTPGGVTAGHVEIAGLYAPQGICRSDNEVGRRVQDALTAAGMRLYRYDEDAAEAALTLNNDLKGSVAAHPASAGVVRIGADNRIPFVVENPNCVDANVVALQFDSGSVTHKVEVAPFTVSGNSYETRVDVDKLASVWNQDVRVTPVIAAGTSLTTEPSTPFWLGDWVRVRSLTPFLYPRMIRDGRTLVAATIERSLRAPGGLTVSGIDAQGRSSLFLLPEGQGEELYLLPFNLNAALAARLTGAGTTATVGTTGIRLLSDDTTAVVSAAWPLTSAVSSSAAEATDAAALFTLIGHVALLIAVAFRSFSRRADDETRDQVNFFTSRAKKIGIGGTASLLLLLTRFRGPALADSWFVGLAVWRASVATFSMFMLLRSTLIESFWKQGVEPQLLPVDVAVRRRRRWNGLIWTFALVTGLAICYTFFWAPVSAPPPGTTVLSEVTR